MYKRKWMCIVFLVGIFLWLAVSPKVAFAYLDHPARTERTLPMPTSKLFSLYFDYGLPEYVSSQQESILENVTNAYGSLSLRFITGGLGTTAFSTSDDTFGESPYTANKQKQKSIFYIAASDRSKGLNQLHNNDVTFEAWVKPDSLCSGDKVLFSTIGGTSSRGLRLLFNPVSNNASLKLEIYTSYPTKSTKTISVNNPNSLVDKWVYISMRHSTDTKILTLTCRPIDEPKMETSFSNVVFQNDTTNNLYLMSDINSYSATTSPNFSGIIGPCAMFSEYLTDGQIDNRYLDDVAIIKSLDRNPGEITSVTLNGAEISDFNPEQSVYQLTYDVDELNGLPFGINIAAEFANAKSNWACTQDELNKKVYQLVAEDGIHKKEITFNLTQNTLRNSEMSRDYTIASTCFENELGQLLETITSGKTVQFSTTLVKRTNELTKMTLMMAMYDGSGKMIPGTVRVVHTAERMISGLAGEAETLSASFICPTLTSGETYKVKVFLWDDFAVGKPASEVYTFASSK